MRRHEGQDRGPRSRAPTQATRRSIRRIAKTNTYGAPHACPMVRAEPMGQGPAGGIPPFCGGTVHVRGGAGFSVMKRSFSPARDQFCSESVSKSYGFPSLVCSITSAGLRGGDRGACGRAEEVKSHEHSLPAVEEVMFEALQNPWFGKSDMRADRQRHTPISYDAVFHIHRWVYSLVLALSRLPVTVTTGSRLRVS